MQVNSYMFDFFQNNYTKKADAKTALNYEDFLEGKPMEEGLSYKEVQNKIWQDYMDGKISEEVASQARIASLTASVVEAYEAGVRTNLFGAAKSIQKERYENADTSEETKAEIRKDILALNNLIGSEFMTKQQFQALQNQTKDYLSELLKEI